MTLLSSSTTDVKADAPLKVLMSPSMILMIAFDPRRSMMRRWAGRPSSRFLPDFSTPKRPFFTGSPRRLMISDVGTKIPLSYKDLANFFHSPLLTLTKGLGITCGSSSSGRTQSLGSLSNFRTGSSQRSKMSTTPPNPIGGRLGRTRSYSSSSAFITTSPWYDILASLIRFSQLPMGERGTPFPLRASLESIT